MQRKFPALLFHSASTLIRNSCQLYVKLLCTTFVKSEMNKLYEKYTFLRTIWNHHLHLNSKTFPLIKLFSFNIRILEYDGFLEYDTKVGLQKSN